MRKIGPSPRKGLLLSYAPEPCTRVNDHVALCTSGPDVTVFAHGMPLLRYRADDPYGRRHVLATLVQSGLATQAEVARTAKTHWLTVHRWVEALASGGVSAFVPRRRGPTGPFRATPAKAKAIRRMASRNVAKREIARRVKLSEGTVRSVLKQPAAPPRVEAAPASSPTPAAVADVRHDPVDRSMDRVLASLGLLTEASPEFVAGRQVACGGSLLILPGLAAAGLFTTAEELYGSLKPGFYGLKTTLAVLALMACVREPRAEGLTRLPPEALGRLVGLDRVPEVKTLRRKLEELEQFRRSGDWMVAMAQRCAHDHPEALGFLYADGHARVYHGQATITKAHIAQMRLSLPAEVDTWVNGQDGNPILVWRAQPNAQLVSEMDAVMRHARELVGERRVTVVFDRGGWSPALFARMVANGFDFLTYRKGKVPLVPAGQFSPCEATVDGTCYSYDLAERGIYLNAGEHGRLHAREVTRRSADGHQTHVVTSLMDLPAPIVACRMFGRWRQENFLKYMKEHFDIDALQEYGAEPDDGSRLVPNPERKALSRELGTVREELGRLRAAYGEGLETNREAQRPTVRGLKIAQGPTGQAIRRVRERIASLELRRKEMPARVPLSQTPRGAEARRLPEERRRLTDVIKMAVYRAETALHRNLGPHYGPAEDEGRALLREVFRTPADLQPDAALRELRIRIYPLSAPRRTHAVAALCELATETRTVFPGSDLVLRFEIRETP